MRTAFIGFKQISGFGDVNTAENAFQQYRAALEQQGIAHTIETFGDDTFCGWLVEIFDDVAADSCYEEKTK